MRLLRGHTDEVLAVAYSPDGKTLATGGLDRTVRLWEVSTGKERLVLRGHPGSVYTVAFSPDGLTLVSGGGSKSVRLWDVQKGKPLVTLRGHTSVVKCAAFWPGGTQVISGAGDRSLSPHRHGQAVLWQRPFTGAHQTLQDVPGGVLSLAFSPDGKRLALGLGDQVICLWDVERMVEEVTLPQPLAVRALAFSPDGLVLASVSSRRVLLWQQSRGANDTVLWTRAGTLKGHKQRIGGIAFTPDGGTLISGCWDGTVRLWDVAMRRERTAFDWQVGRIHAVAVAPDGMTAAAAGRDGSVVLWDLEEC